MAENFEAIIGANIRDFQRAMREVDRQIRDTAMGADADIGADVADFLSDMSIVEEMLADIAREHEAGVDADIDDFLADMAVVEELLNDITQEHEADIDADISEFLAEMARVQSILADLRREREVDIDANTNKFMQALRAIDRQSRRVFNSFERRLGNVQASMDRFAQSIRTFGEIARYSGSGLLLMISPAIVPIIANLIGVLGNLGVMIGTIAGATFALASAFVMAGLAVVAFAAVAMPTIVDLMGATDNLTRAQTKAWEAFERMKGTWKSITNELEPQVLTAFTQAMNGLNKILEMSRPLFKSAATAVNELLSSLNQSLDSAPAKSFFAYLNTQAGPLLTTTGKAIGFFLQGLMNMMTAFGPLTKSTAQGFLEMSERFADWAAGLSNSKAFQTFVSYVETNMPKIRAIFRDAIAGIIYMFAAFGPSASEMMDRLKEMMAGFKEWTKALGENEEFKGFIEYIKENSPKVADLIGNIVTFLKELGIALAPVGSQMLDAVNGFLVWSAAMLDAHPWIGKIIAAVIVLSGAFIALLPLIIAVGAFIGPVLIGQMIRSVATMIWTAAVFVAKWTWMGIVATANAIKIAAAWLWSTGTSMVVAVAKMIASAAVFVAKWLWMGVQALIHAAKVAAAWALATGVAMVKAVASMTATAALFVAKWLVIGTKAMLHAAKVAAAWALSTGAAMAKAVASMIATAAVFVAKWLWMGVQALAHAAKMAAGWFIALGPVGWVIATVVALAMLIIENWDKVSAWTKKAWSIVSQVVKDSWSKLVSAASSGAQSIWSIISSTFNNVVSFLKGLGSTFYNAGKGLIEQIIKGIKSMIGKVTSTISDVAGKVRDFLPFSPAKEGPLSDLDRLDFGGPITDSIQKARRNVNNAMSSLLSLPELAIESDRIDIGSEVDSLKRQIKQELSVDMSVNHRGNETRESASGHSQEKQPVLLQMVTPDQRVFAEWLVDDITEIQEFKSERIRIFGGG